MSHLETLDAVVAVLVALLEHAMAMSGLHKVSVDAERNVLAELVSDDLVAYPTCRLFQFQVHTLADNPALLIVTPLREDPGNIGNTGAPEEPGTLNNG